MNGWPRPRPRPRLEPKPKRLISFQIAAAAMIRLQTFSCTYQHSSATAYNSHNRMCEGSIGLGKRSTLTALYMLGILQSWFKHQAGLLLLLQRAEDQQSPHLLPSPPTWHLRPRTCLVGHNTAWQLCSQPRSLHRARSMRP